MLIERNPFARTELHRVTTAKCGCDWCGAEKRVSKAGRVLPFFRFYTETDGGRRSEHRGTFCSVSCFRSYHG